MKSARFRWKRANFLSPSPNKGAEKYKEALSFDSASFLGGDEEDRTLDLTDANRTLSQLSYAPT